MRGDEVPHFGLYEPVILQALKETGPYPWTLEDLRACETRISDAHCQTIFPHCQRQDVIDWLHRLSEKSRQELIAHLNAEEAAKEALRSEA